MIRESAARFTGEGDFAAFFRYGREYNEKYVKNIYFCTKKGYDRKSELLYSEVSYEVL